MSKSAYTDEEIKQVFQALFTEKKRLKELEQELEQNRQQIKNLQKGAPEIHKEQADAPSEALVHENALLKQQLDELKGKYVNSLAAHLEGKQENASSAPQTALLIEQEHPFLEEENQALLIQLENIKKALRKVQEEAKNSHHELAKALQAKEQQHEAYQKALAEIAAKQAEPVSSAHEHRHSTELEKKNQHLHKLLVETQDQSHRQKLRLEKLAEVIQEKEKRIHELYQYEFTHKKNTEQRQDLQSALENTLRDCHKLQNQLTESQQHTEQLERVIKFLRERSEEGQLATQQFKEDYETSQEKIQRLERELKESHQQLSLLRQTSIRMEQEKIEWRQETDSLQKQCEQLKNCFAETKENQTHSKNALEEAETKLERELNKNRDLSALLKQQTTSIENIQKEIEILKQALVRGMREANELEARYRETVQEKIAALGKAHHMRQLQEKQEKHIQTLADQLKQAQSLIEQSSAQAREEHYKQEMARQVALDEMQTRLEEKEQEAIASEMRLKQELEAHYQSIFTNNQREHEILHEALQNSIDELTAERTSLLEDVAQKNAEIEKLLILEEEKEKWQRNCGQLQEELTLLNLRLEKSLLKMQGVETEFQNLTTSYREAQQEKSEIQEKLSRQQEEKLHMQAILTKIKAEIEEKEADILMAQQHLAKKVKETAILSEELEKYKQQAFEYHQQQMQHQIRVAELQGALDVHFQQEKRLQDQLSEAIRTCDHQVKKWEHKYFEIQEKWQVSEIRKKELEKFEERHIQMQALLANFGSVLGNPLTQPPPSVLAPSAPAPSQKKQEELLIFLPAAQEPESPVPEKIEPPKEYFEPSPPKPYPNLFNMPKPLPEKHRQNLFD